MVYVLQSWGRLWKELVTHFLAFQSPSWLAGCKGKGLWIQEKSLLHFIIAGREGSRPVLKSPNNYKKEYCSQFCTWLRCLNNNEQRLLKLRRGIRPTVLQDLSRALTDLLQPPNTSSGGSLSTSGRVLIDYCNMQNMDSYNQLLEGPEIWTHTWARYSPSAGTWELWKPFARSQALVWSWLPKLDNATSC